jgi:hypothetical protein
MVAQTRAISRNFAISILIEEAIPFLFLTREMKGRGKPLAIVLSEKEYHFLTTKKDIFYRT